MLLKKKSGYPAFVLELWLNLQKAALDYEMVSLFPFTRFFPQSFTESWMKISVNPYDKHHCSTDMGREQQLKRFLAYDCFCQENGAGERYIYVIFKAAGQWQAVCRHLHVQPFWLEWLSG